MKYIVALDQGTTSSRAIVFDHEQNIVAVGQKEFKQIYPQPGWVEHDPMEIWATQYGVLQEALIKAEITLADVVGIGITNQRETTIVWEKDTGKPIYNAIVWQCRRTADLCDQLKEEGWADYIRETTGLVIDAYFSATNRGWLYRRRDVRNSVRCISPAHRQARLRKVRYRPQARYSRALWTRNAL